MHQLCCSSFRLVEAESSERTFQFAPNTASEPCCKLAKRWLSSCLTDHTSCKKFLSVTPFHPTRLIEIASTASASNDELHLREAGEHSPEVPYMTLSHRWGESKFMTLTKETCQRLRDGFPPAYTSSKTFQDAINICRGLGVTYLWIDSLCIRQDLSEDWEYESAQMGQVYENSLCNIAATGAFNSEEGCFKDREGSLLQRCIIKSEWKNQKNGTWEIMDVDFWDARINRAPLTKRGWVMQERLLSPRILHYGRDQILWECGELEACETYPDGLPEPLFTNRSGFKLDPELRRVRYQIQGDCTKSDPDVLYRETWTSIVNGYSVTSLTKEEDKLVAISGIAKRMQSLLDDVYLAGLWRKDLPFQLLWSVDDISDTAATRVRAKRPRPYRAPSWSWASLDGPVYAQGARYDNFVITILDADVTPVGADRTGQIKDGFIRLNGRVIPAKLVDFMAEKLRYKLRVDSEELRGVCKLDTQIPDVSTLSVYYLPVRSYVFENDPTLFGLVLQTAAKGNGTYERIGICYIRDEKSCSIINQCQASKDKSLYENADGETIVLI